MDARELAIGIAASAKHALGWDLDDEAWAKLVEAISEAMPQGTHAVPEMLVALEASAADMAELITVIEQHHVALPSDREALLGAANRGHRRLADIRAAIATARGVG